MTYDGVEERGLADVGEADDAGLQAHAQPGGAGEAPAEPDGRRRRRRRRRRRARAAREEGGVRGEAWLGREDAQGGDKVAASYPRHFCLLPMLGDGERRGEGDLSKCAMNK